VIVADANLLIALVGHTADTTIADDILRLRPRWHAPTLWRSEVANALVHYVRRKTFTLRGAQEHWNALATIIADREHAPDPHRVLALAANSGCTAYDSEYVATAEELSLPLVTSDREVLRAFPRMALSPKSFLDGL
jgi:predicted nucleic acid-binding protein